MFFWSIKTILRKDNFDASELKKTNQKEILTCKCLILGIGHTKIRVKIIKFLH